MLVQRLCNLVSIVTMMTFLALCTLFLAYADDCILNPWECWWYPRYSSLPAAAACSALYLV